MIRSEVIVVPAGYRLDVTSDSTATGYYYIKGNPGQADGGITDISASSSIQIGPFNVDRLYSIVTTTGSISSTLVFEYVQDEAGSIAQLSDVVLTDLLEDDILKYDGSNWVNVFATPGSGATQLDELSDVTISSPADKQALLYNNGTSQFENRLIVESDISDLQGYLLNINNEVIDDLDDVNIVTPVNGQTLVYTDGVWSNEDILSAAIGVTVQGYDADLAAIAGLTSAANKIPMFSGSESAVLIDFKDEDDMSSNSATAVPSQQSVKAYVDANAGGLSAAQVMTLMMILE